MTNWKAWRNVDGEIVHIREGDSGEGLIGPNSDRVPGLDRVTSTDEQNPNDFPLTASELSFTPASGLVSTDVQAAIAEDGVKLNNHISNTNNPHSVTFTQVVTSDSGTDITVAEAEELTNTSVTQLHKHDRLTSPNGTLDLVQTLADGTVRVTNYTTTRDDGKSTYNRQLYVDATGNIQVGEARSSFISNSGRFYSYTDGRWVTDSDDNYGPNYYQMNENAGTAVDPIYEWEHMGNYLPPDARIKNLMFGCRTNNNTTTDFEIVVVKRRPDTDARYASGFDNDAEMENVVLYRGLYRQSVTDSNWGGAFAGNPTDAHLAVIPINHTIDRYSQISIYIKPIETNTGTRYILATWTWEIL